jgi:hypothetical protein
MGGYNSGRWGGRPTTNMSLRVDIAWMIRTGRAQPGSLISGSLSWNIGGESAGSISYRADMCDPMRSYLHLSYLRTRDGKRETVTQPIQLVFTEPHYGRRRWWMMCPSRRVRVGKLYKPNGGDCFAGRKAWRLGYNSQRVAHSQRPFEKLFRLQRKLGQEPGWDAGLGRPKGMWHRTFARHLDRYDELDGQCGWASASVLHRLGI